MPKLKNNKSASKRFRKTASGKVKRSSAYGSHLATKKSRNRKRKLHKPSMLSTANKSSVSKLLPYIK